MVLFNFRAEVLALSWQVQHAHPEIHAAWEPFCQRLLYFVLRHEELESLCASLESECARLREGAGRHGGPDGHGELADENDQLRRALADLQAGGAHDSRQRWEVARDQPVPVLRKGDAGFELLDERLAPGSVLKQVAVRRYIRYEKLFGVGPSRGWVEITDASKAQVRATSREPPTAFLFPSGGRCFAGMLAGVRDVPAVKEMAAKADAVLAWERGILDVCVHGPGEEFRRASRRLPALVFASLAAMALFLAERPAGIPEGSAMLGDSHGVLAALCAAGAMSFEQGVSLAAHVGGILDEALESCAAAERMYIAGPTEERVAGLCRLLQNEEWGHSSCHIASFPIRRGFIVVGTPQGIGTFRAQAAQHLPVAAVEPCPRNPTHTPFMRQFEPRLSSVLGRMSPTMRALQHTVWVPTGAAPLRAGAGPGEVVRELSRYLSAPNFLVQTVDRMVGAGFESFCDVGPRCVHGEHHMKHINRQVWAQMRTSHV